MSEQYSSLSVVSKMKGDPIAMPQPSAISVARPVASWWTAKDALMPAPFLVLPCSYKRRTEGPMPLGAMRTTLMSSRNFSPTDSRWPRRKPCERPRVAPFLRSGSIFVLYVLAWAASEMRSMTRSLSLITSSCTPRVPLSSSKPTALAAFHDGELSRRPILTLMSDPMVSRVSAKFCAWAGAWEPHPITPICFIPSKALATSSNLSRPPLRMSSEVGSGATLNWIVSLVKTLVSNMVGPLRRGARRDAGAVKVAEGAAAPNMPRVAMGALKAATHVAEAKKRTARATGDILKLLRAQRTRGRG
mmetsp:Transcript_32207/g.75900  ORF Transcript_32207/g.75900 Transcript_32207/m.75900 type:complete len:303 (+) Transcript_32207:1094-2002(+)